MNSFLKNYGSTLALLAGLVAGGIIGICSSAAATAVKPVGDLFLNLIFVIIFHLDTAGVAKRMQARSLYGAKRPKK